MLRWLTELRRRPFRPLASLAVLALAPKCVLCLVVYAGLGGWLGLRTLEICGAPGSGVTWAPVLSAGALILGSYGLLTSLQRRPNSDSG